MTIKFALIGHRVPSHGKLNLNDLAGSCGRLDVLLRSLNSALFLSHGIRKNIEVILHLQGGDRPPRRIWFNGSEVKGIHSDERSIAGQISKILELHLPPIGIKNIVKPGIYHGQGNIENTINEWIDENRTIYHLDKSGVGISSKIKNSKNIGFVISDDKPFTDEEEKLLSSHSKISVGNNWIQGHCVIAIIHHYLDQI